VKSQVDAGRPFATAARENRVWSPRDRLFERAVGRVEMGRVERAMDRIADVDRLAKGLRARQADSDPWLELTDLALDIAH
jgi:DNA polymerase III subunit delta